MSAQSMLNIRLDSGLKAEGDSVLAHAGTSATKAIRALYHYMETNQEVPSCCLDANDPTSNEARRAAMRELAGIAPLSPDDDAETIKAERLSQLKF